jgi:hypothetical protein
MLVHELQLIFSSCFLFPQYSPCRLRSGRTALLLSSSFVLLHPRWFELVLYELSSFAARQQLPSELVDALANEVAQGIRAAEARLAQAQLPRVFKPGVMIQSIPGVQRVWGWFAKQPAEKQAPVAMGRHSH